MTYKIPLKKFRHDVISMSAGFETFLFLFVLLDFLRFLASVLRKNVKVLIYVWILWDTLSDKDNVLFYIKWQMLFAEVLMGKFQQLSLLFNKNKISIKYFWTNKTIMQSTPVHKFTPIHYSMFTSIN